MKVGKMHNRESFLNQVAASLGRERRREGVVVPDWSHRPQEKLYSNLSPDELVTLFREACRGVHTEVVETGSDSLQERLLETVTAHGGGPIIVQNDPRFVECGLRSFLEREDVYVWGSREGEENIRKAEVANVGITFSEGTLAESGTVISFHDRGRGRTVCMLPRTHIAIVPRSTIVPRMTEFIKKYISGESLVSCVNFATGPSNSADIELKSVVGVHGPVQVSYILVSDQ